MFGLVCHAGLVYRPHPRGRLDDTTCSLPAGPLTYAGGPPPATEGVQAQYARGEITREQYERRKRDTRHPDISATRKGESK